MELLHNYFRLEIEGIENIPKDRPCLIIPNHSGYSGFDALLLQHEIQKHTQKPTKVLTHHFWFLSKTTAIPAKKLGFIEATRTNALECLAKGNDVILFPEGEYGNFKSTAKAYKLQQFKRGFVRIALEAQTPVVPALVFGAEESHINLGQIKMSKFLRGLLIPLPLNLIPLPTKWKFQFLPPVEFPYDKKAQNDRELVQDLAEDMRERMQKAITRELKTRDNKKQGKKRS